MTTSISLPKEQRSAEERAEERYPYPEGIGQWSKADREHFLALCKPNRTGYATAIREVAEPLELEVARLKALVGEAKELMERHRDAVAAVHYYRSNRNNPHADKLLNSDIQEMWADLKTANNATASFLTKLSKEGA